MFIHSIKAAIKVKYHITWLLLVFLLATISAFAQDTKEPALVTDFFKVFTMTSDKVSQLAEAIPAEKYDWRPAEGVRSVKESILHLAGAN